MTTLTEYAEAAEWFVKELADFRKFADLLRGADKVMVLRLCEFEELAATVLRQLAEGKVLAPLDDLKRLVFAARTTGGTSGRDDELCDACAAIEPLLIAAATQGENS